ncbi:PleD family two-component system response regulator [Parapedobacter sp. GCM10030251]|uniref:response regulator n=1 Tax=Parapedobacter sp. GCM10030251 TaxID=3273419 RepID=UPI00360880A8
MTAETPSKKIAIFDDDEDILAICDYVLSEDGWEVRTFVECDNVVDTVKAFNPDIIIMDNWIPSVGGIEATQQLKASAFKRIPVIYFSANRDVKQLAEKAGAETFLAKPFDVEVLKQIVDETVTKFCGRPQE